MSVQTDIPQSIIILGTGGNCIEILEMLEDINEAADTGKAPLQCLGFLDDDETKHGTTIHGLPVLGPLRAATTQPEDCLFVNGIGSPFNHLKKKDIIASTGIPPERFATLVHPTAYVSRSATLGPGTVIFHHSTVSAEATVGAHVVVLSSSVVSHHDVIGDYTCIARSVSVSGGVSIGASCYIGTNSSIIGNISIGEGSLVGIGSVVLKDVPAGSVVAGNPARFLRKSGEQTAPPPASE